MFTKLQTTQSRPNVLICPSYSRKIGSTVSCLIYERDRVGCTMFLMANERILVIVIQLRISILYIVGKNISLFCMLLSINFWDLECMKTLSATLLHTY